jgi:secreted PhoX family phosphatase
MDRPEDIEAGPTGGKVYAIMTNNTNRTAAQVDKANPRANNRHGHVIEMTEAGGDYAATSFTWSILLLAGDPKVAADGANYAGFDPKLISPISCPDNLCFSPDGTMWIATDGAPSTIRYADGIFAVPVSGFEKGRARQFLSAPIGAEVCGPEFTPDGTTLFCAIQHPGEGSGSTLAKPTSKWPDNESPPRPSVVAIVKTADGVIGS